MDDPKIVGTVRKELGSINSRRLRKEGKVPGTLYGHKEEAVSFSVPNEQIFPVIASGHHVVDLELNGKTEKAIIQDIQWHVYRNQLLHCDLMRINEDEKVTIDVALHARGTCPGVLAGGILEQPHHKVPVECLVIRIPDEISIRIADLQLGGSIHVSDVEWPEGVKCTLPEQELLLQVTIPKGGDDEDEEAGIAPLEPELIGEKKKEE